MSRMSALYTELLEARLDPATERLDAYLADQDAAWEADLAWEDARAVQQLRDSLEIRNRIFQCLYPYPQEEVSP